MRFDIEHDLQTPQTGAKMKTTQTLLALLSPAVAPLAAQAESPDAIKFNDAPIDPERRPSPRRTIWRWIRVANASRGLSGCDSATVPAC